MGCVIVWCVVWKIMFLSVLVGLLLFVKVWSVILRFVVFVFRWLLWFLMLLNMNVFLRKFCVMMCWLYNMILSWVIFLVLLVCFMIMKVLISWLKLCWCFLLKIWMLSCCLLVVVCRKFNCWNRLSGLGWRNRLFLLVRCFLLKLSVIIWWLMYWFIWENFCVWLNLLCFWSFLKLWCSVRYLLFLMLVGIMNWFVMVLLVCFLRLMMCYCLL